MGNISRAKRTVCMATRYAVAYNDVKWFSGTRTPSTRKSPKAGAVGTRVKTKFQRRCLDWGGGVCNRRSFRRVDGIRELERRVLAAAGFR